jgi:aminobenzoyl-glutamate utilization protein B
MGYQEAESSALLQKTLKDEGFKIEKGVVEIPTAFVATFGSSGPVIAFLGEFDALPGLSQKALPYKVSNNGKAGHACGHHLFGTASAAAAIALKNYLIAENKPGIVKYYGCPAEEGGSGKVYMTRAGLFDDVDVALHWHADSKNSASIRPALANKSAKFRFYGVSAHAAGAPEKGRSSLDAVEAMNNMVNMMREHTTESTRIHYVITQGGKAPNVVPDFAEVYYYARHSTRDEVVNVFDRIVNAAKGAALGTGTTMEYEMIGGTHELLHNEILQQLVHKNLEKIGGYAYTSEEKVFAEKISESLGVSLNTQYVEGVEPYNKGGKAGGSTDVGDVSFAVPTVGLRAATWVPGTSAHSWQAVAAGGTDIGNKGMMVAAKTLALTAMQLIDNPKIISEAKKEFLQKRGADFKYVPMLGDRKPALNYRN